MATYRCSHPSLLRFHVFFCSWLNNPEGQNVISTKVCIKEDIKTYIQEDIYIYLYICHFLSLFRPIVLILSMELKTIKIFKFTTTKQQSNKEKS